MSGFRSRVGIGVGLDVGQRRGVPESHAVPHFIGFDDPADGCGVKGGVGGSGRGVFRGKSRYGVSDGVGGLDRDEGETLRGTDASDGYFGYVPI